MFCVLIALLLDLDSEILSMLTVWILGKDLVGDLGRIANANSINCTDPDDILFLWFDSIINLELWLFDRPAIDPQPLQLRTGLCHLHMVAGDWAATVFGWRLPGDVDVLSAGVRDSHLQRRRWSTWRERSMSQLTSEMFSSSLHCAEF